MKRIGVLKDVAYGLKSGGGTTADLSEAELLAPGAMGIYNPSTGVLLAANVANAATALADAKEVVIAFGRTDSTLLVTVPRQVADINRVNGRAYVNNVITVGSATDNGNELPFDTTGTVSVKVYDVTHSSRFGIPSIRANVYKTAGKTTAQVVTEVVAQLNAATNFGGVTAAVLNGDGGFTVTAKKAGVQIEVAVSEMWEGAYVAQTTPPVYGIGAGVDIAKIEKECNVHGEGDGNYIEFGADFFSGTLETDQDDIYDVFTIIYDAYHQGATTKRHVMQRELLIALPDGAATFTPAALITLLAAVFPTYASATTGQELAADTGGEHDGTP